MFSLWRFEANSRALKLFVPGSMPCANATEFDLAK